MTTALEQRLRSMLGEFVHLHTPIGVMRGYLWAHHCGRPQRFIVRVAGGSAGFGLGGVTEICSKGIHIHLKGSEA